MVFPARAYLLPLILYPAVFGECDASTVLVVSNCPSISHSIWFNKIVNLLSSNGHKVIFMDVEPESRKHPNVTHIHLEGGYAWREELDKSVGGKNPGLLETMAKTEAATKLIDELIDVEIIDCRKLITSPTFKKFLRDYKETKIDLIVFDFLCESFFGLVPFFGDPPFVVATAFADPASVLRIVGHYDNPAYVPAQLTTFDPHMSFSQRARNLWVHVYHHVAHHTVVLPAQQEMAQEVFGKDVPHVGLIGRKASLVMVNTHFITTGAKPLPPAIIPVGGVHVDPPEPLPKKYKDFLDGAKNGAIFLSFGSNVPSSGMSKEKIQMFINVFKGLAQRVLWKFETDNVEGLPSNIMIAKWLPQNDVLGHPNVKAFISHGGLLGSQEAIHHGVPIIGIPFMFDQFEVLRYLENEGVAVKLDYPSLTEEHLKKSLDKVFKDGSLSEKMTTFSQLYHDLPQSPKQRALFWLEYTIRNYDKKNYLRSASLDLHWYQLIMLDIFMFFVIVVLMCLYIFRVIIKTALSLMKTTKTKDKRN